MKKFAERLKELRTEKNLSLAQLAEDTGLSQSALSYWEIEKRVPNGNAIITLSRYFGVSTDYLLGEED